LYDVYKEAFKLVESRCHITLMLTFLWCWWLMPSGGRDRRIKVQRQHRQIVPETLSQKALHKTKENRAGGVAQGEGPEIKPQYCKKKKKKIKP
jgi:hypothetical protein